MSEVFIVVTAYSEKDCIGRAWDSILAQTLSNGELIDIDHRSTDIATEIVQRYVAQDGRVNLI